MTEVVRQERGWPGHFICAYRCVFHRNTLLTYGETRIVVSTVGQMRELDWEELKKAIPQPEGYIQNGCEPVGWQRYYETMAFYAQWEEPYWEIDASREISFDSNWRVDHCNRESDKLANDIHEKVVNELTSKLQTSTL